MKRNRIMKTFILILLTAALAAALPVSAGTEVRTASPVSVNNSRTLNVLFIGNSFSLDTTGYLYDIVKQTGCRICLGVGWISGAKLPAHVSNALSDAQKYTYEENTAGSWGTKKYNKSLKWRLSWIMKRKKWDVIVLQVYSTDIGYMPAFYPEEDQTKPCLLEDMALYCRKKCPRAHIGYNMSWALPEGSNGSGFDRYDGQMDMCRAAWDTTRRLLLELTEETEEEDGEEADLTGREVVEGLTESSSLVVKTTPARAPSVEFVIPTGTAVQNARSSYLGDTLNRDHKHLNYGLGRYIAAMTVAASLGCPVEKISSFKLSESASSLHLPLVKASVEDALDNPFSLSEESRDLPVLAKVDASAGRKSSKVTCSWSPVAGATGYKIRYKTGGSSTYKIVTVGPSSTFFQFTGKRGKNRIRIYALGDRYISESEVRKKTVKF
jgi:hypothetical protein